MRERACQVCGGPVQAPRRKRCSVACDRKSEVVRTSRYDTYRPRSAVYYFTCKCCERLRVSRVAHGVYCARADCRRMRDRERMRALNARHREAGQSLWQKRRESLTDEQRRARDVRDIANGAESRRRAWQKRRAQKRGVDAEAVTALAIYERDGWVCGICSDPVDPDLRHPHPKSPSLDHVIPLSLGGSHTAANVRLAHLDCNVRRGNRVAA